MSYVEPTRKELDDLDVKDLGVSALVGTVVYERHGADTGDVRIAIDGTLAYSGACAAPERKDEIDAKIEPSKLDAAARVKATSDAKVEDVEIGR